MQNTEKIKGYLIGRFSPLHTGHKHLIRTAAKQCNKLTIFIGSANSARTIKNPWTFLERKSMIELFLNHEDIKNVNIVPQNDYMYNDGQWMSDITNYIEYNGSDTVSKIFGMQKAGNDYLDWFPQYDYVNIDAIHAVTATDIRETYFKTNRAMIPSQSVIDDYDYFAQEKIKFQNYPYAETLQFNCGDAVVECFGHILMICRKRAPGAGTWALPGGHKNNDETFEECVFRELQEETNLRVPEKVLRGSIVQRKLYDSPYRGMGIPRNTLAIHFKINLNADGTFPEFRPADDAIDAKWVKISDILNDPNYAAFDDHSEIISDLTGVKPLPAYKNNFYR